MIVFKREKMPCRVVIEKKEDGDELVFVFKDEATAFDYSDTFPPSHYRWICWDGYYNAFWTKRKVIH